MNTKKILHIILFLVITGILLFCFMKPNYDKSSTYIMTELSNELSPPSITFYDKNKTFTFTYDYASSALPPSGTFELSNNQIIAITDDANYTYVFDVVDSETIKFVHKATASAIYPELKTVQHLITTGTEFKLNDLK